MAPPVIPGGDDASLATRIADVMRPPVRVSPRGVHARAAIARITTPATRTQPRTTLGARVRLPINLFEAFDAGVRVDLCRTNAGMTEQFLHRPQIGAAIYEMRSE